PCSVTAPVPPALSTLSLHDALPIWVLRIGQLLVGRRQPPARGVHRGRQPGRRQIKPPFRGGCIVAARGQPPLPHPLHRHAPLVQDRKSTRLNSSHVKISYAVFCLKK